MFKVHNSIIFSKFKKSCAIVTTIEFWNSSIIPKRCFMPIPIPNSGGPLIYLKKPGTLSSLLTS